MIVLMILCEATPQARIRIMIGSKSKRGNNQLA
jgi:hypothetical protein